MIQSKLAQGDAEVSVYALQCRKYSSRCLLQAKCVAGGGYLMAPVSEQRIDSILSKINAYNNMGTYDNLWIGLTQVSEDAYINYSQSCLNIV